MCLRKCSAERDTQRERESEESFSHHDPNRTAGGALAWKVDLTWNILKRSENDVFTPSTAVFFTTRHFECIFVIIQTDFSECVSTFTRLLPNGKTHMTT